MPERDEDIPVLDYHRPPSPAPGPSSLVAGLLCIPSLLCWAMFVGQVMKHSFIDPSWFCPLSLLAAAVTIFAMFYYNKRRYERSRQWYLVLCFLVIGSGPASGLAFLLASLGLL